MANEPCDQTFTSNTNPLSGFDEAMEKFLEERDFKTRLDASVDYSAAWAYVLALASGWAYAKGQILADKLHPFLGKVNVTLLQVENATLYVIATAYVIEADDAIILAFRGTDPEVPLNWLTDFETAVYDFGSKKHDLGKVHSGFLMNVEAVWPYIHRTINPLLASDKPKRLFITGHSLGAAMAVIAAARIHKPSQEGYEKWRAALHGIYTFAQPYVGDEKFGAVFGDAFASKLHRHVFRNDVVPCLPPAGVELKFAQFGDRRSAATMSDVWKEDRNGDRQIVAAELLELLPAALVSRVAAWRAFSRQLRFFGPPVRLFSLDDHSPHGYIEVSRTTLLGKDKRRAHSMRRPGGPLSDVVHFMEDIGQKVVDATEPIRKSIFPGGPSTNGAESSP